MESEKKKVGSYLLGEPLGRGGMGVVYRGRHATLPREVAIKSVGARGRHDLRSLRHRFEREAVVQSQLDHPGIVKVYDYVVSEQAYYIVMEYVEGHSLGQVIAKQGGPLPTERALDLFEQILEAVAYAHTFVYKDVNGAEHRGLVHRDLKPPNILVTPAQKVKIADFGLVKLVGSEADTSGIAYGSPHYVSPEQARGEKVDQRSDIYSLGVILYEMLTGSPPFDGSEGTDQKKRTEILRAHAEREPLPPSASNPEITPAVEKVILRALEKKPERRYATAEEFYLALRAARGREVPSTSSFSKAKEDASPAGQYTGPLGAVTGEVLRDDYHTQPITSIICAGCGSEVGDNDKECSACGRTLGASHATDRLVRRAQGRPGRDWVLVAGVFSLMLVLTLAAFYFLGGRSRGDLAAAPAAQVPAQAPTAVEPSPQSTPPAVAASGPVVNLKPRAEVDSSYDGYNAKPLTDGVTDVRRVRAMRYNQGNWVSAESPEPHWISLTLERPALVTTVYVYWGFDRDRFMPSRQVELQVPEGTGDGWRTIARLETSGHYDRAAFEFEPVLASALRIVQPAQQGPSNRPFVMWVREVEVFGRPATP